MKKRKLSKEEEKEIEESKEFIRSIVEEGSKTAPYTDRQLLSNINELREILIEIENYKNYEERLANAAAEVQKTEKSYNRLRTKRRFEKFVAATLNKAELVKKHKNTDLVELENRLNAFESFLDKKYWDIGTLNMIRFSAMIKFSHTIEEAVAAYEGLSKDDDD